MDTNMMLVLQYLHDDLEGRYDGAPDSSTLWMGEHLSALTQFLDGTSEAAVAAHMALRKVIVRP